MPDPGEMKPASMRLAGISGVLQRPPRGRTIAAAAGAAFVAVLVAAGAARGSASLLWPMLAAAAAAIGVATVLVLWRVTAQLARIENLAERATERAAAAQIVPVLYARIDPPFPLPAFGDGVIDPATLLFVADWIAARNPKLVVELGSGASTPVLAHLMKRVGGRLVSVEHDADWARRTREEIRQRGLQDVAEVCHAPLVPVQAGGAARSWYDPAAVADAIGGASIDLLIVDGPPGRGGPLARYPAMPLLKQHLSSDACVVLDDCQREDERRILKIWLSESPAFSSVLLQGHKRAAVIRTGAA